MSPTFGSRERAIAPPRVAPPVAGGRDAAPAAPGPLAAVLGAPAPAAAPAPVVVPASNAAPGVSATTPSFASAPNAAPAPPAALDVPAADFWERAAADLKVAFDFLTPPSFRARLDSLVGSYADIFGDLCASGYSEAEAFQSICLQDASRRAAGVALVAEMAAFLRAHPEFLLTHSLPGPPPGAPSSAFTSVLPGSGLGWWEEVRAFDLPSSQSACSSFVQ
ncbi:uncharacterized protein LOC104585523 [Brachypodium distachyon]|uniref:uncharacterized protein LOC104585523 n=1 Tax=Brachypodium distachyon TaxID=15368 RepID=UPI00052FDEB3|nr:uncharacterized protein LOC104585523 [Brachypodium distachyon]|eukprot:XP_010240747.1 uncharacterized protein LOC104585523 [Brachypodium distachyon]